MIGGGLGRGPQSSFVTAVAGAAMAAADEKLGLDPVVLDLRGVVDTFDALVVTSGRTDRQVRSLADEVERRVDAALGVRPTHVEGLTEGEWVALDYGDVIVHVFDESAREYYDLEHLWSAPATRPAPVRG
ncbi:MAG: ribosome silencing factor [Acidimicrobiales bacterium]